MTIRYNENNRTTTGEANELLGTTSDGKLPAVDGSQLTNLTVASGSNNRSLTYVGVYGTVVTVNVARNSVYAVSSSGPNFTITSALRSAYVNGDIIYVVNYGNYWFSLVNSDSAAGTKLFVKGVETTNWRVQQGRGTFKLRLTTHTNGALYVHVCEDLSILDDLTDVVDTHNSVPVGATLKYNPYVGKWKAKQNWMPKVLVINNSNAINYLTRYQPFSIGGGPEDFWYLNEIDLGATKVANVPGDPDMSLHPTITGWTDFFDDASFYDYDRFVIVFNITPNTLMTLYKSVTGTTYTTASLTYSMQSVSDFNVGPVNVYLPPPDAKWVGKKITFICDGINTNSNPLLNGLKLCYKILRDPSAVTGSSAYIDIGDGVRDGINQSTTMGPIVQNNRGSITGDGNGTAVTLMLTDDTYYPLKPGTTGETTYANAKMWVQCPF